MQRFLIEVPHSSTPFACNTIVTVFLTMGSHFLSHADWGCLDGVHSAWIIMEAPNKEEARLVIPPQFRAQARIVALNTFTLKDLETVTAAHVS